MFDKENLLAIAPDIAIICVGAVIVWWLIVRTARRARAEYAELLRTLTDTDAAHNEREFVAIQRRLTALKLVVNSACYALFLGAGLMIFHQLGVKLDALVLPAGFLGAALGLGAQSLIKDVVAGLFIIFEGQFSVGDVVSINGTLGTVEVVGLRVTHLRDDNGQLYFFPNGSIANVAKYPSRHVALDLWVELKDAQHREAGNAAVVRALEAFEARYDALEDEPRLIAPTGNSQTLLHYRLSARPSRVATAREKLPLQITNALASEEIAVKDGAPIEITNAPA